MTAVFSASIRKAGSVLQPRMLEEPGQCPIGTCSSGAEGPTGDLRYLTDTWKVFYGAGMSMKHLYLVENTS